MIERSDKNFESFMNTQMKCPFILISGSKKITIRKTAKGAVQETQKNAVYVWSPDTRKVHLFVMSDILFDQLLAMSIETIEESGVNFCLERKSEQVGWKNNFTTYKITKHKYSIPTYGTSLSALLAAGQTFLNDLATVHSDVVVDNTTISLPKTQQDELVAAKDYFKAVNENDSENTPEQIDIDSLLGPLSAIPISVNNGWQADGSYVDPYVEEKVNKPKKQKKEPPAPPKIMVQQFGVRKLKFN